jgi:hypothetical protein
VPERAWWYDDTPESRKYQRAVRRQGRRQRGRSYLLPVLILAALVAASLVLRGGLFNPKTTCTTTAVTAPGIVSVQTHCQQVRHFP